MYLIQTEEQKKKKHKERGSVGVGQVQHTECYVDILSADYLIDK